MASYGPYGTYAYGLWQDQCDYNGYPVTEHQKTYLPVLFSPHYDNLLKSSAA